MQVQLHCFWLGAAGSSVGVHADYRPVLCFQAYGFVDIREVIPSQCGCAARAAAGVGVIRSDRIVRRSNWA